MTDCGRWAPINTESPLTSSPHRNRRWRIVSLTTASLFLAEACGAGWHRPSDDLAPRTLPAKQQVQVWQSTQVDQWHGVYITSDSVSGIPYHKGLDCTPCRISVPQAAVDSIRLGDSEEGVYRTVLIGAGLLALLVIVWPHSTVD